MKIEGLDKNINKEAEESSSLFIGEEKQKVLKVKEYSLDYRRREREKLDLAFRSKVMSLPLFRFYQANYEINGFFKHDDLFYVFAVVNGDDIFEPIYNVAHFLSNLTLINWTILNPVVFSEAVHLRIEELNGYLNPQLKNLSNSLETIVRTHISHLRNIYWSTPGKRKRLVINS